MLKAIVDFFWPLPPNKVSRESKGALLDVWVRHSDRQRRAANREWLKPRAVAFSRRWAVVSCVLWLSAWIAPGRLVAEVPLALAGFATGIVAMGFFFIHRTLNR
jgi:hypothetical protein